MASEIGDNKYKYIGYSGLVCPYNALRIGKPSAKSLDWVTNIEYKPALPILWPWLTTSVMTRTVMKIILFVISIDKRNFQLTAVKSKLQRALKIIAGRANVHTNVSMPFDSTLDNSLNLEKIKYHT